METLDVCTESPSSPDREACLVKRLVASATPRDPDSVLRIRPRASLLVAAFASFLAAMVPVFGLLYWHTLPNGPWPQVLIVNGVLALTALAVVARQLTVFTAIGGGRLSGNGIFSRTRHVPIADIGQVVLVEVYPGHAPDSTVQLVALSGAGRTLFRLRGHYWHRRDVEAIAAACGARVLVRRDAMSSTEFFTAYPGSRYWFEGNRTVRIGAIAVFVGLVVLAAVWLSSII